MIVARATAHRLLCPACCKGVKMPPHITLHSTEEGWGEMVCDKCKRKLRTVVKGYAGSRAEVPAEHRRKFRRKNPVNASKGFRLPAGFAFDEKKVYLPDAKAARRPNPVYEAYSPNPIQRSPNPRIPLKLMQPRVAGPATQLAEIQSKSARRNKQGRK